MSDERHTICKLCRAICHETCSLSAGHGAVHDCAGVGGHLCKNCAHPATAHEIVYKASNWEAASETYRVHVYGTPRVLSPQEQPPSVQVGLPPASAMYPYLPPGIQWWVESFRNDDDVFFDSVEEGDPRPYVCPDDGADAISLYFNTESDVAARLCPTDELLEDAANSGPAIRRGTGTTRTRLAWYLSYHVFSKTKHDYNLRYYQVSASKKSMRPIEIKGKVLVSTYLERAILVTQVQGDDEVAIMAFTCYEFDKTNGISRNNGRVYVSYLDSTALLDKSTLLPNQTSSDLKQLLLDGYANYASALGFSQLHLWSCTPYKPRESGFYILPQSPFVSKSDEKLSDDDLRRKRQGALDKWYSKVFGLTPWHGVEGPNAPTDDIYKNEFPLFPGDFKLECYLKDTVISPFSRFIVDLRGSPWYGRYYEVLPVQKPVEFTKTMIQSGRYDRPASGKRPTAASHATKGALAVFIANSPHLFETDDTFSESFSALGRRPQGQIVTSVSTTALATVIELLEAVSLASASPAGAAGVDIPSALNAAITVLAAFASSST